jgi:uncharacterized protein with ParB-like and HNH nuclease domain
MEITFDRKTINTCLQQRFALPTFQREYRWQASHVQELLTDIQDEFGSNYDATHSRAKVAEYSPYFLGTIITTTGPEGARLIVDGQQRLTTITLLLAYIYRHAKNNPDQGIANVEPMLRRQVFGASAFNLEFDSDRKDFFEIILDKPQLDGSELDDAVESIADLTDSTKDLYRRFCEINDLIAEELKAKTFARFVDYVIERVYLFEIGVPREQDGHKVFVTMNDRGLRLAPLDLLKGHLLSNIDDNQMNSDANGKWSECIKTLRDLGRDEDSVFFRTWLRAQYANTSRGKSRGDAPADFEILGDAYHRWVENNSATIGLINSDDFYNLVVKDIPFYVSQYKRLRDFEVTYSPEFAHVFFNGSRGIALQHMAILAAIQPNDSGAVIDKKIKMISFYIDALLSSRVMTGKDNTYDNIKDQFFALAKQVRRKDVFDIKAILATMMDEVAMTIPQLGAASFKTIKRQDLLHLLARLATHLEDELELTSKVGFPEYINRSKGNKTFDIEHVVTATKGMVIGKDDAGVAIVTDEVTSSWRDSIGALILLPRGRNRSLQDQGYVDKRVIYATENVLALSLTDAFYKNHPNATKFISEESAPLAPVVSFTADSNAARTQLYCWIAARIWDKANLSKIAPDAA